MRLALVVTLGEGCKGGDNMMFGNLFKKTEPEYWLVEKPGSTMVLLFPDKFRNIAPTYYRNTVVMGRVRPSEKLKLKVNQSGV
jgi:hypothetical protein